jgi:multimeric flavodoxin WrbA
MSTERPLVLGIAGSIRNRAGIKAVEGVDKEVSGDQLTEMITGLEHLNIYHDDFLGEIKPAVKELSQSGQRVLTNSDSLVLTALYGAHGRADVEFHKLTDYVGMDTSYADSVLDESQMDGIAEAVERADGIILGSPVYFGDRSSLMHSFLNFAGERGLLEETVVGMVSCGSKRNGGQETTNVYALFESLDHGAYIVGNGPKTCQYGGTGWGGDIGDVAEDDFGLETSLGTGLRVAQAAQILRTGRQQSLETMSGSGSDPFKVGVVISREQDDVVTDTVSALAETVDSEAVKIEATDFSKTFIQACIGCDVCPTPGKVEDITGDGEDYKCIIDGNTDAERWEDDDLQHLHDWLVSQDALVIAVRDDNEDDIRDVYQALLERTRYLRRDDWRLHNTPLVPLVVSSPDKNSTYPMKIMTSWMRHNTIVAPPIQCCRIGPETPLPDEQRRELEAHYNELASKRFRSFIDTARRVRAASTQIGPDTLSYKATGYENKMLDVTEAKRM